MPNNSSRQVRFFHAQDRDAANQLANHAAAALATLGLGDLAVEVQDLTNWNRAKPRIGTIELWLALPEAKAG
jgi:hypothetical protein